MEKELIFEQKDTFFEAKRIVVDLLASLCDTKLEMIEDVRKRAEGSGVYDLSEFSKKYAALEVKENTYRVLIKQLSDANDILNKA